MSDTITGGCYCGAVKYRATPPVLYRAYCHCENCRRAVGAQVVAWITVESSNFEYTHGSPKLFATDTGAVRTFCRDCGTSLAYSHPSRPNHVDLTTGSLDQPEAFVPDHDVYPEERLSWTPLAKPHTD